MSKTLLLASAAIGAVLTIGEASAQTPMDWTGFYFGGHAGHLSGDVNLSDEGSPGGGNISGFVGGVLGGYNFMNSPLAPVMLGVEGDFGWANVQGSGVACQVCGDDVAQFHYDLEWDAHIRLRAALLMGNFTLFAAGGLAFARLNITEDSLPLWDNVYTGGTIGGGLDVGLGAFIGRAEVLYDIFPTRTRDDYSVSMHNFTARVAAIVKLP